MFGKASVVVGLYARFTRSSRCRGAVTSLVVCANSWAFRYGKL